MLQSVPQACDLCMRAYFNNKRELLFGWTQIRLIQVDRMWFVESIDYNNVLLDVG